MKTLILYATKHGCAGKLARRLQEIIAGSEINDLKAESHPPLAAFDAVILGSSIYAGAARKEFKDYIAAHGEELKAKKLGFFFSGLSKDNTEPYFSGNIPKTLLDAARAKGFFGGAFDKENANFFEKLIMRVVIKSSESYSNVSEDAMMAFAKEMQEG